MKLLIVQLSDLHIKSADDPILERAAKIGEAARSQAHDADACLLLLTGDVAFSGEEEQYLAALELVERVKRVLETNLKRGHVFKIVAIPGNHDLNFASQPSDARTVVVDTLRKRQPSKTDGSMIEVCAAPQAVFFDFRDAIDATDRPEGNKAYYEYFFSTAPDATVRVRCCNTALTCMKGDRAGQLYFPWDEVKRHAQAATIDVTLLHHPYNWFTPPVLRGLKNRVEEVSDIVLTGHEHQFSAGTRTGWEGGNEYLC